MSALDTLERVSLLLVLCGLAVIYGASVVYKPPVVSLSAVDSTFIGDTVRVTGNVTSHHRTDAAQFLTLQQGDTRMKAVYFGNSDLDVDPGRQYRIEGRVDVYQGELEIIARDLVRLTPQNTGS